MAGDDHRYNDFIERWSKAWPSMSFNKQYCFNHSPKFRSLGLFACNYLALNNFLDLHGSSKYDYVLVFEDDGVPFPDTTWPGDLNERIDLMEKQGAEMLIMGGHAVYGHRSHSLRGDEMLYTATDTSGSYGFMIKASTVRKVIDEFGKELSRKKDSQSGIDHYLWKIFGKRGRISVPLLIDHRHGESHTWAGTKKPPTRDFEGRRDFWNFKD